ncbi:MAG: M3 family oligoendopeptidase [Candidatus Heimdallarchaeota archaeon]
MTENEIAWDLSEIFLSPEDPNISNTMDSVDKVADELVKNYKGKINSSKFLPKNLLDLIKKNEKLIADLGNLDLYANRLYDANQNDLIVKGLKKKIDDFQTEILKKITFIDIEIGKLFQTRPEIIEDSVLKEYKQYLKKFKRIAPHLLSEVEEQVILEKDQFGIRAWSDLQSEWLNSREYIVNVEGKEKALSYGEANSLLTHPDRETRISTNKSIYGTLGKEEIVYSTALRNIFSDWLKITERRKFDSSMHHSFIANDTTKEIIDNLMKTMEESAEIYQRYLKIKAKILGFPILSCADVYAPLPNSKKKSWTWNETKEVILEAYRNFDESFETYASDMFEKKHIDAAVRKGKTNGAYCDTWYNGKSCYILLSFTGSLREIYTLAHELGHAIHGYMASREQTVFNLHPGATVAETASIFGELLLTDLLLSKADSLEEKKAILAQVLDEAGHAAFQVSSRVWFEQSLYDAIKNNEALDGKSISKYWVTARDKIYGDSVDWFEEMDWEWAMKGHYYIPNFRYYNYPYVYAQLFVYALYRKYKSEGKSFIPKFKRLLKAGGSLSPVELGNIMDLDITKPDFWKLGIKQYEEFVNQLEELI